MESWPNPSLENGVSEQAAKGVLELAIVRAQLPKSRCDASLCITPSFDKYSHDETRCQDFYWGLLRMCANSLLRSGNNVTGDVYCLRRRDRVARTLDFVEITSEVPTVLPDLGPEIIAVMQAGCSSSPNDWPSGPCLAFRKSDDTIIPLMVLSFDIRSPNSRTVGVLNFWVHWRP